MQQSSAFRGESVSESADVEASSDNTVPNNLHSISQTRYLQGNHCRQQHLLYTM